VVLPLKRSLVIFGRASKTIVKVLELPVFIPGDLTLMDFLMFHKITIASSCAGAGTCKKCNVNDSLLSCQVKLKEFVKDEEVSRVEISYL
jgi:Na+-transporting NADH:ubiquinone oxidoreductase subunit NqrF